MNPGDSVELAGHQVTFKGAGTVPGPNYTALRGTFELASGGKTIKILSPEKRSYPAEKSTTTEAAIHTTPLADVYIVLGDADGKGGYATRMYYNPLVPWIWAGVIFMAIGGMVSLTDRRLRVGAPKRAGRKTAPVAQG
jgi:cytochrome c-type biogenesis protein CcmF